MWDLPWYVLVLLASLCYTVAEVAKKKVLAREHALEFSTVRTLFTGLMALVLIPYVPGIPPWRILVLIYAMSLLGTAGLLYQTKFVRHLAISVSAPLHNLGLILLLVWSALFLGERPGLLQLGGIALIMAGTYFLEPLHPHERLDGPIRRLWRLRHFRYALVTAVIFSIVGTLDKHIVSTLVAPTTYLVFLWLFIMANFLVLEVSRFGLGEIKRDIAAHGGLIFVVAFFSLLNVLLYFFALTKVYVSYAAPLKRISTLFVTLVGGRIFAESQLPRRAGACLLMIAGAFLIIY